MTNNPTIGFIFEIRCASLRGHWVGHLEDIYERMSADGIEPASIWNRKDTEIRRSSSRCSYATVVGKDLLPHVLLLFSRFFPLSESTVSFQRNLDASAPELRAGISRLAFATGAEQLARLLGEANEYVLPDSLGMTPIAWACAFGQTHMLEICKEADILAFNTNRCGWNLADLAKENDHSKILEKLASINAVGAGVTLARKALKLNFPMQFLGPFRK